MRNLAAWLLGVWLGASLLMDMAAIQNFRSVGRVLESPSLAVSDSLRALGRERTGSVLRAQAGEANRRLFQLWEDAELAVAAAVVVLLLAGSGRSRVAAMLAAAGFVIVVIQAFGLTPQISALGQLMETGAPRAEPVRRFWLLHGVYSGLELLKIACALAASIAVINLHQRTQPAVPEMAGKGGGIGR